MIPARTLNKITTIVDLYTERAAVAKRLDEIDAKLASLLPEPTEKKAKDATETTESDPA